VAEYEARIFLKEAKEDKSALVHALYREYASWIR